MERYLQIKVGKAVGVLLLGILFLVFSADITTWLVMLLGVAFIFPGVGNLLVSFRRRATVPVSSLGTIVDVGCICFGLVLLLWPSLFIDILMYLLAAWLVVSGVLQFRSLWRMQRDGVTVSILCNLVPLLMLGGGVYIFCSHHKESIASLPIVIVGCGGILYALLELWSAYKLYGVKRAADSVLSDAVTMESPDSQEME